MEIYEIALLEPVDVRLSYKNNSDIRDLQDMLLKSQAISNQVRRLSPGYHTFMPKDNSNPTVILVEENGFANVWEIKRRRLVENLPSFLLRRKAKNLYESNLRTLKNPNLQLLLGHVYNQSTFDPIVGPISQGQVGHVEKVLVSR